MELIVACILLFICYLLAKTQQDARENSCKSKRANRQKAYRI